MTTLDLNQWLREEHSQVDELVERVAERAAMVPRRFADRWLIELRERFDQLRFHLNRHIALEEQDGYMRPVLERRPDLSDEVEALRHEHRDLLEMMDQIHDAMQAITLQRRLKARDCCERIKSLLLFISDHEHREDLVVLSAFSDDVAAED